MHQLPYYSNAAVCEHDSAVFCSSFVLSQNCFSFSLDVFKSNFVNCVYHILLAHYDMLEDTFTSMRL